MEGTSRWAQIRLYLTVAAVIFLLVVIGLNFTQESRFWWFGVHRLSTGWLVLALLALGFVAGFATAYFWRRRGED
ncbi:hypothetical protein [Oceanithermus sp.]